MQALRAGRQVTKSTLALLYTVLQLAVESRFKNDGTCASPLKCTWIGSTCRCPGGLAGTAELFSGVRQWVDTRRLTGSSVVYTCFDDHCQSGVDLASCTAGNGTGCGSRGRNGLMCESCIGEFLFATSDTATHGGGHKV